MLPRTPFFGMSSYGKSNLVVFDVIQGLITTPHLDE